jgi:transcriptional regulator with XRE-family HTH domain
MMDDFLPVAEQLRILFEKVQHPDGRPYTMQEVSDQIDVSLATIGQLRTGKITNPQLHTLREICRFFGVPLRYFETRSAEACYAILAGDAVEKTPEISEIVLRAVALSPASQRDILTVIKWVQAAEQQRGSNGTFPPLPNLESYDED